MAKMVSFYILALTSVAMPLLLLVVGPWAVIEVRAYLQGRQKLRTASLDAAQATADHQAALERERAQAALVAYFR